MTTEVSEVGAKGQAAREAARALARTSTDAKNKALLAIAHDLLEHESYILSANREDIEAARAAGLPNAVQDRLFLSHERLEGIANDVRQVALFPDPVGEMIDMRTLPNGIRVGRRRVPLGVIGAIYESRPNVTIDIACLCLKSGNACILRGGKEAIRSNSALASIVREAIAHAGVPQNAVQLIENTDRALLGEMLRMRDTIDLVVPRGGAELIRYVAENATMPVLTGGIGVCHTYVDRAADVEKAVRVVNNAKTRKYSICNALDTVLVHEEIAEPFLPEIGRRWSEAGVEMRCDDESFRILNAAEIPGAEARARRAGRFRTRVPRAHRCGEDRGLARRRAGAHSALWDGALGRDHHRGLLGGDALRGRGRYSGGLRQCEHAVHGRGAVRAGRGDHRFDAKDDRARPGGVTRDHDV